MGSGCPTPCSVPVALAVKPLQGGGSGDKLRDESSGRQPRRRQLGCRAPRLCSGAKARQAWALPCPPCRPPDKVVEGLLPAQPADGRQHAKQVAAQEHGVGGVPRHARHQGVGCVGGWGTRLWAGRE